MKQLALKFFALINAKLAAWDRAHQRHCILSRIARLQHEFDCATGKKPGDAAKLADAQIEMWALKLDLLDL